MNEKKRLTKSKTIKLHDLLSEEKMTQNDTALHQAPARQQPWLPGIIKKGIFLGEIIFWNSESICLILTTIIWIIC